MKPQAAPRHRRIRTRRTPARWLSVVWAAILAASGGAGAQPAPRPASQPPPPSAAGGNTLVVEGFEKISTIRSWPEKLEAVTEGEGVTEGKQAARAPGGQFIRVKLRGPECTRYAWLKFDVQTLQPLSHPFRIVATAPNWERGTYAYAQAGQDTIAMPLSHFFQQGSPNEVDLDLVNISDRAVILDNVRLEMAATPPAGCVALDFGSGGQAVWPGFAAAGTNCPQTVWSGKVGIGAWQLPMPDMLTGTFVGPNPGSKVLDSFDLVAPERNCTAWLWITHYAGAWTQPLEYFLSFQGRNLTQRRIPRDQLLGPEGLMEGMGGDWSPKWFDSVYAGRFAEVLRLQLSEVRSPITVGNCQLAALAIAPSSAKAAMTAYVAQAQADVTRYRRQFLVGFRNDPLCELNPSEAEAKAGMILLCPPQEEAFRSGWRPRESDRAEKVSVVATGGLLAAVPVCLVPLKKAPGATAVVGPLRSADGRQLACEKDSPEVLFCKTVPKVLWARVDREPWLLTHKGPPVGEKQVAWMVLKVTPVSDARAGLYQGAIRVTLGGTTLQVPLEVRVVPTGPDGKDGPTLGLLYPGSPADYYTSLLTEDLPDTSRDALQQKTCQQLAEWVNAFCGSGVMVTGPSSVVDGGMPRFVRLSGLRSCRGYSLFNCQQAVDFLRDAKVPPGSRQYEQLASQIVSHTASVAAAGGVKDYHIVLGAWDDEKQVPDRVRVAAAVQAAGGSAAVMTHDASLRRMPKDQFQSLLSSAGALIIGSYQANFAALVDAYKKARPGGRAYVHCDRADRFAVGLFAAGVGADGAWLSGARMNGGTYNGFFVDGAGLVALDADRTLVPTVGTTWLEQGLADFLLVRRAEALARAAAAAKAPVPELTKALADLKADLAKRVIGYYDASAMRLCGETRTETEAWRVRLLEACGKAWTAMHPSPEKAGG